MMEQTARDNSDCKDKDGSDKDNKRDDKNNRDNKEESKSNKSKDEGDSKEKRDKRDTKDKRMSKLNEDAIVFLRKRSAADAAHYAGSLRSIIDLQRKRQRVNEARQSANRLREAYATCRKCARRKESGNRDDEDSVQMAGIRRPSSETRSRDRSLSVMSCDSESDDMVEGRHNSRYALRRDNCGGNLLAYMASANRSDSMEPSDACRKKKKKKKRCPKKRKPCCPKKKRKPKCCKKACCKKPCCGKKKKKKRC